MTNIVLLTITVIIGAVRNIFSKNISSVAFGGKSFYRLQTYIFLAGGLILLPFVRSARVSAETVYIAIIYSIFLMLAQWCYTSSLSKIDISLCSTIYSMGFIIPTLSGSVIWNEEFNIFDFLGLCIVIAAIIISGYSKKTAKAGINKYFVALIIATLSSGGLGLVQKIQQSLPHNNEVDAFIVISFFSASIISFVFSLISKKGDEKIKKNQIINAILAGMCFSGCNFINTLLAGRLDSSLFFPLINISVVLLSIILGCTIGKEKFTLKNAVVFGLSVISIALLNK